MKRMLLISWPSRTFLEIVEPLIFSLSEKFNIVILLSNHSTPKGTYERLSSMKKNGEIVNYYITPPHDSILKNHLFILKKKDELKRYCFDVWITISEMQTMELYILETILPSKCFKIIMWQNITFLFMYHKKFIDKLLGRYSEYDDSHLPKLNNGILNKIRGKSIFYIIKKMYVSLYGRYVFAIKKMYLLFDRVVLPGLFIGKTFVQTDRDKMTQIGSGRSDMLILFDPLEVKVHQILFKEYEVRLAEYPSYYVCDNNNLSKDKSKTILSPLSNFVGLDIIDDDVLSFFLRDFRIVLSNTGCINVDLRLHPDESGKWPTYLANYLLNNGINVKITKPHKPLREVLHDYSAVAGSASASLRDCAMSCKTIPVIGFESVSSWQFKDPKYCFGLSEGIGWIDRVGNYDSKTFSARSSSKENRQTVVDIVNEVLQ